MKKKTTVIAICVLAGVFLLLTGLTILNTRLNKIADNDISVTGNTAGNLNQHGLFCESDGMVYFSNAYDNGSLYSMTIGEADVQKLANGTAASINAAGDYLYYFMDTSSNGGEFGYVLRTYGVYRARKDGTDPTCLDRNAAVTMQLIGNYIYYQRYNSADFTQFYKIKTDKTDNVMVADAIINPGAVSNGIIYYNGQDTDHYLYALDTRTDTSSLVWEGDLWYPVYRDGYIYYMDVADNYKICRYSLSDGTAETLTQDRADSFNLSSSYIYYQKNDATAPALMRMRLDGSDPEVVADGNYSDINITSQYVYFHEFNNEVPVYHTPADSAVDVQIFTAARDAAFTSAS